MDLPVPFIHHDPSDLGSLILMRIQIIPKERIIVSVLSFDQFTGLPVEFMTDLSDYFD